jgi:LCP family protein required for cell wall assembly
MRNPFRKRPDPLFADRYSGVIRGFRGRRRRLSFLRRKWVVGGLFVLLIAGGIAGYAAYFYYSLQGDVQEVIGNVTPPVREEDPFNVLLVGSDSRRGLTEREQERLGAQEETAAGVRVSGERADTLILAHVDPNTEHVTMVQFPRDLYVSVPTGGKSKINESLEQSKANLVQTVEDLTGLDVNRYAQVNIAGFRDLVDAIGGVEVCIPEPIPHDPQTGIEVPPEEVGMVEFGGDRALRFVRSRNFPTGDFERIQNQQKLLSAVVDKITSPETFLYFGRILELKRVAGENLRIDSRTSLKHMYDILKRFRAFDPANYEAYVAPNLGTGSVELESGQESSIVRANPPAMKVMFKALGNNESPAEADGVPDVDPSTITVGVYNGTDVAGAADRAADRLRTATQTSDGSIVVDTVANASRQGYKRTIVHYEKDGDSDKSRLIAAAIKGARARKGSTSGGIDVEVIVGRRFDTTKVVQLTPLRIPTATELPPECR